jgi:hypothetical protein
MKFVKKVAASIKPTVHLDELKDIEIHFLISWFVHHMPMEQRRKLMEEQPVIYKKMLKIADSPEDMAKNSNPLAKKEQP